MTAAALRRFAPLAVLLLLATRFKALRSTTTVELKKRYAGTVFGPVWIVLYPLLLLAVYVFVYMVVFKVRFPGYSEFQYVVFVFSGISPYLAMWEAVVAGSQSVKQNIHLVRNIILPIELVPIRTVTIALVSQLVTTVVVIGMAAWADMITWRIVLFPAVVALQFLFLVGLVLIVAGLGAILNDVAHVANLIMLLFLFISPIGFKPEMIPPGAEFILTWNPFYYITEAYRGALIYDAFPPGPVMLAFVLICIGVFTAGTFFFYRFKSVLVDYE